MKAIVQSDVNIDKNTGAFNLNFAGEYLDEKRNLLLSEDDELMINSFNTNIDTKDLKLNDYVGNRGSIEQIDSTQSEIKYIHQNLKNFNTRLSLEKEKLSAIENYLDVKNYKEWKEDTPYLISFHANFKEDVFGLKEFNVAQKCMLVNEDKNRSNISPRPFKYHNYLDFCDFFEF